MRWLLLLRLLHQQGLLHPQSSREAGITVIATLQRIQRHREAK